MKLGFSTLGCPDWPYPTIVAKAREYGFDGFEIRLYGGRIAPEVERAAAYGWIVESLRTVAELRHYLAQFG